MTDVGTTTSVKISQDGYHISSGMVKAIDNDFLNTSKIEIGGKFYFLNGTYDQVVLEKIYNLLETAEYDDTTLGYVSNAALYLANARAKYNAILKGGETSSSTTQLKDEVERAQKLYRDITSYIYLGLGSVPQLLKVSGSVVEFSSVKEVVEKLAELLYKGMDHDNVAVTAGAAETALKSLTELKKQTEKELTTIRNLTQSTKKYQLALQLDTLIKQTNAAIERRLSAYTRRVTTAHSSERPETGD